MVYQQFAGPGLAGVVAGEMHERGGEQRQAHGGQNSHPAGAAANHRTAGQSQEAEGDRQQRRVVQPGAVAADLEKMHRHRGRAQRISGGHEAQVRAPEGGVARRRVAQPDVQQHGRQNAQYRETDGHEQVQQAGRHFGVGQYGQGSQVPHQRKHGYQGGPVPAAPGRPPAPAVQQAQKDGENQRAGRVAQNVDEHGLARVGRRQGGFPLILYCGSDPPPAAAWPRGPEAMI